jgi:hypothetical protein
MQRCGDLLQRESLITDEESRKELQHMANTIGKALE